VSDPTPDPSSSAPVPAVPPDAPAPSSPPDPSSTPDDGATDPSTDPSTDPDVDPTPPRRPRPSGPVQYKGEDLDEARGPGLGCFRFQLVILVVFIILTPLSVAWSWPSWISAVLLFAVIGLPLVTGQTIIFLLRLVAADRRSRRRPLGSATKTVGELEDEAHDAPEAPPDR
jgi:hypothetical protein